MNEYIYQQQYQPQYPPQYQQQYQPQYQPQMSSMLTAPPCAAGTYNIPVLNKCATKTEVAIGAGALVVVLYLLTKG